MTMRDFVIIALGISFWHLGGISMIGRFVGPIEEPWLVAPKGLLLNRAHLWGCCAAFIGIAILIVSDQFGFLAYGILATAPFIIFDAFMIYRALRECER
jgi:hypothetical protein